MSFDVAQHESFHNRLSVARKACKITQADMASAIGIAQGQVSKLESGAKEPTPEQVAAIEAFLAPHGVPAGWLQGGAGTATVVSTEDLASVIFGDDVIGEALESAAAEFIAMANGARGLADSLEATASDLLSRAVGGEEQSFDPSPLPAAELPGQVTVEEAIVEAGTPEQWADVVVPIPTPQVAPIPPAPLPALPPLPPVVTQVEVPATAPALPSLVAPVVVAPSATLVPPTTGQGLPAADPLAVFFQPSAPVEAAVVGEVPVAAPLPPVAQPAPSLLGFAQPVTA